MMDLANSILWLHWETDLEPHMDHWIKGSVNNKRVDSKHIVELLLPSKFPVFSDQHCI